MLMYISNFFYDPWIFWGVPAFLALVWEGYCGLSEKWHGYFRRS